MVFCILATLILKLLEETFYFERIVDLHAVVKNSIERPHIPFTQFPPMVTSCITVIPQQELITSIQPTNRIQTSPVLHVFIGVCVCVYVFRAIFSHVYVGVTTTTIKVQNCSITGVPLATLL